MKEKTATTTTTMIETTIAIAMDISTTQNIFNALFGYSYEIYFAISGTFRFPPRAHIHVYLYIFHTHLIDRNHSLALCQSLPYFSLLLFTFTFTFISDCIAQTITF